MKKYNMSNGECSVMYCVYRAILGMKSVCEREQENCRETKGGRGRVREREGEKRREGGKAWR